MGVGIPIGVDNALRFFLRCVHGEVLQLRLKLVGPHPVAATKDCCLAYEPLVFRDGVLALAVDGRGHDLVNVLALLKGTDQIILLR